MIGTEPSYLKYLFVKAKNNGIPLSGTFEITNRCNFNCRMCYIHNSDGSKLANKELSAEQWKMIADEAQKAGTLMLLITGGEPLIRPDFPEIYIYCKKLGFEVNINTNASLITDDIIEMFREYPPARVNITLYGANEDTYRNTTCREGNFEKVTENIRKLKAAGIQVKMNVTASEYNSKDIPKLYDFAKDLEIPVEAACYLFPSARLGQETDRPSAIDAAKNSFMCEKCGRTAESFEKCVEAFKNFTKKEIPVPEVGDCVRCRAGTAAYWITYEGFMLPCGMMEVPKSSVVENGFTAAWEAINREIKKVTIAPECSACEYFEICESCAAAMYAETGKFDGFPAYLCQKTHEYVRLMKEET